MTALAKKIIGAFPAKSLQAAILKQMLLFALAALFVFGFYAVLGSPALSLGLF